MGPCLPLMPPMAQTGCGFVYSLLPLLLHGVVLLSSFRIAEYSQCTIMFCYGC